MLILRNMKNYFHGKSKLYKILCLLFLAGLLTFFTLAFLSVIGVYVPPEGATTEIKFDKLMNADKIVVWAVPGPLESTYDKRKLLKTITDVAVINDIKDFLKRNEEGWFKASDRVFIGDINLDFYRNNQKLGSFGIGGNYLAEDVRYFKYIKREDSDYILNVIGI